MHSFISQIFVDLLWLFIKSLNRGKFAVNQTVFDMFLGGEVDEEIKH
jgi:hypothetical protein